MNVDFTKVYNFATDFDGCDVQLAGEIINYISTAGSKKLLATLKAGLKYYDKFKVIAVYDNNEEHCCDEDDLKVLIENYSNKENL